MAFFAYLMFADLGFSARAPRHPAWVFTSCKTTLAHCSAPFTSETRNPSMIRGPWMRPSEPAKRTISVHQKADHSSPTTGGDYVAFLLDRSWGTVRIIKDPTGNLPCFTTEWRHVIVAFSCLRDCTDLNILPFTVNWSYVASRIGSGGHDHTVSPLNEVSQVHRGAVSGGNRGPNRATD